MKVNFFSAAFDKTLRIYNITGKALSEKSGVSQNHISSFRKGENITIEALSRLMEAMEQLAPGSASFFLRAIESVADPTPKQLSFRHSLEVLIESASDEEMEGIMMAIARRWRVKSSKELCA